MDEAAVIVYKLPQAGRVGAVCRLNAGLESLSGGSNDNPWFRPFPTLPHSNQFRGRQRIPLPDSTADRQPHQQRDGAHSGPSNTLQQDYPTVKTKTHRPIDWAVIDEWTVNWIVFSSGAGGGGAVCQTDILDHLHLNLWGLCSVSPALNRHKRFQNRCKVQMVVHRLSSANAFPLKIEEILDIAFERGGISLGWCFFGFLKC